MQHSYDHSAMLGLMDGELEGMSFNMDWRETHLSFAQLVLR